MSKVENEARHYKTGIKTTTFYNQKKLKIFPKLLLKPRIEATNAKSRPSQSVKKFTTGRRKVQKPQKSTTRKSTMSNKGSGRKRKTNAVISEFETLAKCKVGDVADLQIGNRCLGKMDNEDYEQGREFKKIKLDLNKNFECRDKCSRQTELCNKEELENKQAGFGKKKIIGTDKVNLLNGSSDNNLAIDKREATDTNMNYKNDINSSHLSDDSLEFVNVQKKTESTCSTSSLLAINQTEFCIIASEGSENCGTSISSCQNDNSMKRTAQNSAESYSSSNVTDSGLSTGQDKLSEQVKESGNHSFGSSSCHHGKGYEGAVQNNAKLNNLSNLNDDAFTTVQRKSLATKESENDLFGSPLLFSSSQISSEESVQSNSDFNNSQSINDKTFTIEQTEPFNTSSNDLENDIISMSSFCESAKVLKQKKESNKKSHRTSRKKMGSLDAFVFVENKRTSKMNEKLKGSGFHEPFRILGEFFSQDVNCPGMDTSPLLISQSSSSTGYSGSSKSKSISPESQSSITKYFTPLRKSSSVAVVKSSNVSPTADKKGKRQIKGRKVTSPSDSPVSNKKEQMFLDLGQKNFGHITCPTCNMVYTSAQPEDEAYHIKFHHKVVSGLRFKGWKNERVVEHFDDGRVIVVLPQDPPSHLNKVSSVRSVVDDELGFSSETTIRMQDSKTYMFVAGKKVVGCVVAVAIQEAFPLLPCSTNGNKNESSEQGAWCCSSAPVRAQCGISRVWVLQQYRRKRIATRILDCVRNDFIFGGVVSKDLLAFSDPTPLGKQLAEAYCGNENFLVFR